MAAGLADTPTSVACPAAGLEDAAAAAAAADADMFQAVEQQRKMPERGVRAASDKAAANAKLQTLFSQQQAQLENIQKHYGRGISSAAHGNTTRKSGNQAHHRWIQELQPLSLSRDSNKHSALKNKGGHGHPLRGQPSVPAQPESSTSQTNGSRSKRSDAHGNKHLANAQTRVA